MTSLHCQYLLCPPLACSTARTHQHPKIATSRYFTWETRLWQQEKHHQMSQVSDEYRHRQSETVSVKTAYAPDVLILAQYWDIGIDLQGSDSATEYGAGTCKTGGESGSEMNQDSCCRKEMAVHVSTDAGMRDSQGTAFLRSTIAVEKVWWYGVPYPTPEKLNWCTSPATLALLDTEMRFWDHSCCPKWTSVGTFFSTTTLGRTQFVLLLLTLLPTRT
jgi:hypothetical protein